jgi:mono/diheme cytochrome c family protein
MRRALRWLSYGLLGVGYLYLAYPIMAEPAKGEIAPSAEKLARGTYLAEHVTVCTDCHSERDWTRFSGPPVEGTFGKGGERFGHEMGFPGEIHSPNITAAKLGSWSDGEIVRALTSGVTPDGRALFPLMNYPAYSKLCKADIEALVTYVRTLKPIENTPPQTTLDFPVNLIVRTMPTPAEVREDCPDPKDSVAYGKYLVNVSGCADCHTPRVGPNQDLERIFAGGMQFPLPTGTIVSKNITPDASGIGSWSREAFIKRFATYRDPANVYQVEEGDAQSVMPWAMFSGMTDEDLGAIYDYLRTVKPIQTSTTAIAAK